MNRVTFFNFSGIYVHRLVTGQLQENTYLVYGADKTGIIVDPGDDAPNVIALVAQIAVKPTAILLTHAHFDHIGAVEAVRMAFNIPVYLHVDAQVQYANGYLSAARFNMVFDQPADPDFDLNAGLLEIGGLRVQALFTPGHAPGHIAFYFDQGFVLSGDALFKNSIGRTDLPGCDHELLLESIRTQLLILPPKTVVLSGHGSETTIERELLANPHLR